MKNTQEIKTTISEVLMASLYPGWREEIVTPDHDAWAESLPVDLHALSSSDEYIDAAAYLELFYANKASGIKESARKLAIVRDHAKQLKDQLEMIEAIESALLFNITSGVQ